jgi:hypothetical protein
MLGQIHLLRALSISFIGKSQLARGLIQRIILASSTLIGRAGGGLSGYEFAPAQSRWARILPRSP